MESGDIYKGRCVKQNCCILSSEVSCVAMWLSLWWLSLMLSLCWKWNASCVLLLKGFLLFESLCYGECLELRILTDCSCLQGLSIPLLAVLPFFPALPGRTLWVLLCITSVLRFIFSVMWPSFLNRFIRSQPKNVAEKFVAIIICGVITL